MNNARLTFSPLELDVFRQLVKEAGALLRDDDGSLGRLSSTLARISAGYEVALDAGMIKAADEAFTTGWIESVMPHRDTQADERRAAYSRVKAQIAAAAVD